MKLYRLLKTRQDLIPSQERQVEIVPGARNHLLSLVVWELSVTYDHSCDAALQCKVTQRQDVGLVCVRLCAEAVHTEVEYSECELHSPEPFHACLAPP